MVKNLLKRGTWWVRRNGTDDGVTCSCAYQARLAHNELTHRTRSAPLFADSAVSQVGEDAVHETCPRRPGPSGTSKWIFADRVFPFSRALPRCQGVRYPYSIGEVIMLAKKTSKNQVTLPKKALQEIPETDYFDVTTKDGVLILRPVTMTEPGSRLASVRRKIKALGIEPNDVDRAIAWARGHRGRRR